MIPEEERAERERTVSELNRAKYGDSLAHFSPPLDLTTVFYVAEETRSGSLVGYELHLSDGSKVLVGHANEQGGTSGDGPWPSESLVVAARKVWL